MLKRCIICEKEFETNNPRKQTCSTECSDRRKEEYFIANRERFRLRQAAYYSKNKERVCLAKKISALKKKIKNIKVVSPNVDGNVVEKVKEVIKKVCPTCGKEFETTSKIRKFCSFDCYKKDNYKYTLKRSKEVLNVVGFLKNCLESGKVMANEILQDALKNEISERLLNRARKKLGVVIRKESGGLWVWRLPTDRLLNVEMNVENKNLATPHQGMAFRSVMFKKVCAVCGKEFETHLSQKKYCSPICRSRNQTLRISSCVRSKKKVEFVPKSYGSYPPKTSENHGTGYIDNKGLSVRIGSDNFEHLFSGILALPLTNTEKAEAIRRILSGKN